jgi:hypothetical protein
VANVGATDVGDMGTGPPRGGSGAGVGEECSLLKGERRRPIVCWWRCHSRSRQHLGLGVDGELVCFCAGSMGVEVVAASKPRVSYLGFIVTREMSAAHHHFARSGDAAAREASLLGNHHGSGLIGPNVGSWVGFCQGIVDIYFWTEPDPSQPKPAGRLPAKTLCNSGLDVTGPLIGQHLRVAT